MDNQNWSITDLKLLLAHNNKAVRTVMHAHVAINNKLYPLSSSVLLIEAVIHAGSLPSIRY